MIPHAAAVFTALFVWWFATGAVLYANGMPRRGRMASVAVASVVLGASLAGLHFGRDMATAAGAYLAFLCAIGVWGWHELMFLSGLITGPRTTAAPPEGAGISPFRAAAEVVLYHEVALALTLALVAVLTFGGANQVGLATFAVLWVSRLSAKFNVFLGVRNLSEDFLPAHLAYVETYFRRQPMNPLLPFSAAAGLLASGAILHRAWSADASPFLVAGGTLTGTLILLAVIEHILMVAPFSATGLWRWAMSSRRAPDDAGPLPRTAHAPTP